MKKLLLCCLMTLGLTGCFSFGKAPPQNQYMLHVDYPQSQGNQTAKTLQILSMRSLPQFANNPFVYRVSDVYYLTDYYHVFFVPPDQQMTEITMEYLKKTHIFKAVSGPYGMLPSPDYYLSGAVQALYADYRDKARPVAVMSMSYTIVNNKTDKVVLNRTYEQRIPLQQKTSAALLAAWNVGLKNIMRTLTVDLQRVV